MNHFLNGAIGPETVQAAIHQTLYHLEEASWLKEVKDSQQRETWLKEARYGLRRMLQEGSPLQVPALSDTWTDALCACAQALGFQRIRLLIDLSEPLLREPPLRELESLLPQWAMAGILATVFLPTGGPETALACYEIRWEAEMLRGMMEHRYKAIFGGHRSIGEIIEPGALDNLIQRSLSDPDEGAPRHLSRLWRQIAGKLPDSCKRVGTKDI
jgi:hypothetical protein